jgi:hypothetical protein
MNYKNQILKTNGSEFQVTYTKKDGTTRSLTGHIEDGYTQHASGKDEYVVVFDSNEQDYRTVNTNTVTSFQMI